MNEIGQKTTTLLFFKITYITTSSFKLNMFSYLSSFFIPEDQIFR